MSDNAAFEAGYVVGRLSVVLLLIGGAVLLGRHLGKKKDPPRFVAWPLVVAVILVLMGLVGSAERARGSVPEFGEAAIETDSPRMAGGVTAAVALVGTFFDGVGR